MVEKQAFYKKRLWQSAFVLLVVVFLVGFRLVEDIGFDISPESRFVVVRVLDGDTVELAGGDRLRLLSVDTPEKDEPLYNEATVFLQNMVLGKTARIVFAGNRRDKYGRLLGYLYIDTVFVNAKIIEAGLGHIYLFKDTELDQPETKILFNAQHSAMHNKYGCWNLPRVPEKYYLASAGSFRFHRPGCTSLKNVKPGNLRKYNSREDAFAEGLSPCRNCKP